MVSAIISRFVILTVGTLYPAYRSYKGVKTKNVREYVKWMMYWIIFALFLCAEAFADIFVAFWCPLYYELKIAIVLWLISPYTKGASLLYRKFVHPFLLKHEKEIDLYLDRLKKESYTRVVRLGNRGINYAKEAVATAALRSHEHIIGQLRKTASLNDVNDSQSENMQMSPVDDDVDLAMVIRRRPRKQRPALAQAKGAASRMTQSVSGDFVKNQNVNQEEGTEQAAAEEEADEQSFYGQEASSLVEQEFGYLEEEAEEEDYQDGDGEESENGLDDDENDEDYVDEAETRKRQQNLSSSNHGQGQTAKNLNTSQVIKRQAKRKAQDDGLINTEQNGRQSKNANAYATLPRRSQRKTVKKQ